MATTGRRQSASVIAQLQASPYQFEFFQAVRLLESSILTPGYSSPYANSRLGSATQPCNELVRFKSQTSLAFVSADVLSLQKSEDNCTADTSEGGTDRWEMEVGFSGLAGSQGVLPYFMTEVVQQELKEKNSALKDFLDLFNHRHISLLYRAWQKYQLPVNYEQSHLRLEKEPDLFTQVLASIAGMGTSELRYRLPVPDDAVFGLAGHLGRQQCSATGLAQMIRQFFGLTVSIDQFQGQWDELPTDVLTRLPCTEKPKGVNNRLGMDTIIGTHCFQAQNKFRVVIEPMGYDDHMAMAPGGRKLEALKAFVQLCAGVEMDFEISATLVTDQVEPVQLCHQGATKPLLGWNTHMSCEQKCDDQVYISLSADQMSPDEALPST
ncbi:type VI secretion system baseplate subunit TssG [Microbulbifer agarilyticus]|uniref:type VI secretion system baseplate subunit TssG n=1 Tax=Microbulbifer agarilyticus TaxID=260552 RepID=UPI001C9493F6|nr:type VI secretion system baseplate subunit TssG [Microbulbifer agarilyticus]MBY6210000.1 type VI secretion system baseplate subunit TssG [Microbulbifer agarilyticus]